jgi:hypothetical protein
MSGFMTRAEQFKKVRENAKAKQEQKSGGSKYKNDPRIIKTVPTNTYKLRLIFWTPENSKREEPFIRQRYHSAPNAEGKWLKVICPVTHHGNAGFKMCPVCENNSKLYESGEAGNETDKELYKKFKWKFNGYALAYVVQDPVTPENEGTVKIFRYGIGIDKFLQKEVMGLKSRKDDEDIDPGEIIGFDALNKLQNGFDLIVEVEQDGKWPKYSVKFSRKATSVDAKLEDLEDEIKALNFDEFYKEESATELQKFFNETVLQTEDDDTEDDTEDETIEDDNEDESVSDLINELEDDESEESVEESVEESADEEEEQDDLDDLLAELDED